MKDEGRVPNSFTSQVDAEPSWQVLLDEELISFSTSTGYAGPSAWNSLPEHLRAPDLTLNSFRHSLKTFLFTQMTHAAH